MTTNLTYLAAEEIVEARTTEAPRPRRADGYGNKIPTRFMVRLKDKRWRRVYVRCWSNAGTSFVVTKEDPFTIVGPEAEHRIKTLLA